MSQPLVSIVIDNYNYAPFVAAAIRSALEQTYKNLEVIVVDDGSTDESREVIAAFGNRVKPVFQDNRGQSGAFDAGFVAARGGIVIFLDSDDALRPEAVAEIVAGWRPTVAKVQFCLATVDADGRFVGNVFPNFPPDLSSARIRAEVIRTALYPCPPTSGNAYSRWFLEKTMPLPRIVCGADGPLNTVAPLYGEVVTIDKPLGYYRVHDRNDGAQGKLKLDKFANYIRHDRRRVEYLRKHAERLGLQIHGDPLERAVLHLQYRLASLKLLPDAHPIGSDRLPRLLWLAMRAAWASSGRIVSRLCTIAWLAGVALGPRRFAQHLVALRFVPSSRPAALRTMLRRLGVLRAPNEGRERELDLPRRLVIPVRP
jgi:glycosyltransferase involved in cell wall biosynthesis